MHAPVTSIAVSLLVTAAIAAASPATAAELEWQGTLRIDVGDFLGGVSWKGTGVATVNGSGGGVSLATLRLGSIPFPTTLTSGFQTFSVPTHPLIAGVSSTYYGFKRIGGTTGAGFAGGTFTGFSGGGPLGGAPIGGLHIFGNQYPFWRFDVTQNDGGTGFGVGGTHYKTSAICIGLCTNVPYGYWSGIWMSVAGAPWTLGTVTVVNSTPNSFGPETAMANGFIHGPASNTSTVAQAGGVLQMVTPMQFRVDSTGGNWGEGSIGYIGKLDLRFIPEPERLLLIGAGALGLVVMGWRRRRS